MSKTGRLTRDEVVARAREAWSKAYDKAMAKGLSPEKAGDWAVRAENAVFDSYEAKYDYRHRDE
jgi:hypothetical protein